MNKFKDLPKQGHKYFRMAKNIQEKNPSLEVLLFPYMYGQPQVFMRGKCIYFESQDWVAVQGGMGSAHGYHETWSWRIPREDADPVVFKLSILTTTDEKGVLWCSGSFVGFMEINEISHYLMEYGHYKLSDDEAYVPIKSKTVLMHMYSGLCGTVAITRDDVSGDERAFIKPSGSSSFEETNIVEYRRYRDGGTCIIITDEFVLYVPTPFKKDAAAICCPRNWECTDSDWIEFASGLSFSDYENPDNPNVVRDIEYTPEGMHFAEQNGFVIDVMGVNADRFVKKIEDVVKRFGDEFTSPRFPYTYHHDLVRNAYGADISRSDVAALKNWSILELYASALTQLSNECGSKITEFLFNGEDLNILHHARKIADKHIQETKLLLKLA